MQLLLMLFLSAIFLGVQGVLALIFLDWMTRLRLGEDSPAKHGISMQQSSRLGGLSVAILVLCFFLLEITNEQAGVERDLLVYGFNDLALVAVVLCALMGLAEDLRADFLSPRSRLVLKFLLFGSLGYLWPELVPTKLGLAPFDFLLSFPVMGWLMLTIFLVGFINAVNMADGANGLVAGIVFCALLIFYQQTGRVIDASLVSAFGVFLIFNVVKGRLFLGDMGTYGAGCAVALYSLVGFNLGSFSLMFLAALFAYPCIDFLVSIGRRLLQGRSPFSPDNDHLHNRIYFHINKCLGPGVLANSLTGLLISGSTSGVVLLGYSQQWWPISSNEWGTVFVVQIVAYFAAFYLFGRGRGISQYAEAI